MTSASLNIGEPFLWATLAASKSLDRVILAVARHVHGHCREQQLDHRHRADMIAVDVGDDESVGRVIFKPRELRQAFSAQETRLYAAVDQQAGIAQRVQMARRTYPGTAEERKPNSEGMADPEYSAGLMRAVRSLGLPNQDQRVPWEFPVFTDRRLLVLELERRFAG